MSQVIEDPVIEMFGKTTEKMVQLWKKTKEKLDAFDERLTAIEEQITALENRQGYSKPEESPVGINSTV